MPNVKQKLTFTYIRYERRIREITGFLAVVVVIGSAAAAGYIYKDLSAAIERNNLRAAYLQAMSERDERLKVLIEMAQRTADRSEKTASKVDQVASEIGVAPLPIPQKQPPSQNWSGN